MRACVQTRKQAVVEKDEGGRGSVGGLIRFLDTTGLCEVSWRAAAKFG
jgi:hypothetical protein